MDKIASPTELQQELRKLLAYAESDTPSREKLASGISGLADRVAGMPDGSVGTFLKIMQSHITQWDAQHGNDYSLGQLLQALEKVERRVSRIMAEESPEALDELTKALRREFTSGFSPLNGTVQAITLFLRNGRLPKFPVGVRYRN